MLFGAWAYLAHDHGRSEKLKYYELSQLPIYAYVADTTKVSLITESIAGISAVSSVEHESGFQAALELIQSYGLELSDEMIADYDFEDLITIHFEPTPAALDAREKVIMVLDAHLDELDIDSQEAVYQKIVSDVEALKQRQIVFSIFVSVIMFLIFIFVRLSYELDILVKRVYNLSSPVDILRHKRSLAAHNWLLLILPVGLTAAGYYGGVYLEKWEALAADWTFVLMAALVVVATFINALSLNSYERNALLDTSSHETQDNVNEEDNNA
nr:hypothetical protein [Candidatus Cloacimonadota bacterium]